MLDVRRLLVLRAVAHHGSLAAARVLGSTQPAVTDGQPSREAGQDGRADLEGQEA